MLFPNITHTHGRWNTSWTDDERFTASRAIKRSIIEINFHLPKPKSKPNEKQDHIQSIVYKAHSNTIFGRNEIIQSIVNFLTTNKNNAWLSGCIILSITNLTPIKTQNTKNLEIRKHSHKVIWVRRNILTLNKPIYC